MIVRSKFGAALFSVLALLGVLWPIRENWQPKPKDRFPLSYYPMFSHKRGETYTVNYFIGHDSLGNRLIVPYRFAGGGGFNQVRRQINQKVKRGKGEALTQKVAKRLAQSADPAWRGLTQVSLVTGTYVLDRYFMHRERSPLEETIVSTIPITKP